MLSRRLGSLRARGAVACAPPVVGIVLALALAGCGDQPVPIESPGADDADRSTCRELLAGLPEELAGEPGRLVTPDSALGAAWGEDPPILLTCGVTLPDDFDEFAECEEANGVGWFVPATQGEDQSEDVSITAAGYRPVVQVRLPAEYRPEGVAAVMSELAVPVSDHLELVQPCL